MRNFISTGAVIGAMAMLAFFAGSGPASANTCGFEQGTYSVIDEGQVVGTVRTVHLPAGLYLEGRVNGGTVKYKTTKCLGERHAQLRKLNGGPDAPGKFVLYDAAGTIIIEFYDGDEHVVLELRP